MQLKQIWSGLSLFVTLACTVPIASAEQPSTTPPRGHAYGYRLRNANLPLRLYMQPDGSRLLVLNNCHPRWKYEIVATCDLLQWDVLGLMAVGRDGTGRFIDAADLPYCFYDVRRVR